MRPVIAHGDWDPVSFLDLFCRVFLFRGRSRPVSSSLPFSSSVVFSLSLPLPSRFSYPRRQDYFFPLGSRSPWGHPGFRISLVVTRPLFSGPLTDLSPLSFHDKVKTSFSVGPDQVSICMRAITFRRRKGLPRRLLSPPLVGGTYLFFSRSRSSHGDQLESSTRCKFEFQRFPWR